jgi:glycosyltransferase involved in cell wall biosynthesis
MKPTLSVVVITHNEQVNIVRCLTSVTRHRFASVRLREIFVVDSQSTDRTVAMARTLGARVVVRPWPGFSAQKNWALKQVKGDWILSLDADEEMTEPLWQEIENTVPSTPGNVDGYSIKRRAFFLGKWIQNCGWWPDSQMRLIRRDKGRFNTNPVHEGLEIDGEGREFNEPLDHHTYTSIGQYIEKMDRYSALAAAAAPPKKRRFWRYYLLVDPFLTFFRMYVSRRGFLDGWHGLVVCGLSSFHSFVKYARLWEREALHREG